MCAEDPWGLGDPKGLRKTSTLFINEPLSLYTLQTTTSKHLWAHLRMEHSYLPVVQAVAQAPAQR